MPCSLFCCAVPCVSRAQVTAVSYGSRQDAEGVQIFVKTLEGATVDLGLDGRETADALKDRIRERQGGGDPENANLYLMHQGAVLKAEGVQELTASSTVLMFGLDDGGDENGSQPERLPAPFRGSSPSRSPAPFRGEAPMDIDGGGGDQRERLDISQSNGASGSAGVVAVELALVWLTCYRIVL